MTSLRLNRDLLQLDAPEQKDVLLCIDFGTALSKAAMSRGRTLRGLAPLELGRTARDPRQNNRFVLQSSLFISYDGKVYFGHEAVDHWNRQRRFGIRRLDSMKSWLSRGPIQDLDVTPVEPEYLPSNKTLTKGEALTLLLAYITAVVGKALEKQDASRHVRRRFARPVWDEERGRWCDEVMAKHLTRAQIVADSLGGKWYEGIELEEARNLLARVREEHLPDWLIEPKGVLEPVAAGYSRLERDFEHRSIALVIDIGAGTTDFAAFGAVQPDGSTRVTKAVPIGKTISLTKAGDFLDQILLKYILNDVGAKQRDEALVQDAEGNIRKMKERLFIDNILQPTFRGGTVGSKIHLDQFVKFPEFKEFERELTFAAQDTLNSVSSLADVFGESIAHRLEEISVVATGGGARLPIVNSLASGFRQIGKHRYAMTHMGYAPNWFEQLYPDDHLAFPQLAVALGGASQTFPTGQPEPTGLFPRGRY